MTVSSRTPEGYPADCPLCGAATNLEFSDPAGDAPCPSCGHLLWMSADLLAKLQSHFANSLGLTLLPAMGGRLISPVHSPEHGGASDTRNEHDNADDHEEAR